MNILVVHNKEINYYPPVKSLVDILLDLGNRVTLITYDRFAYRKEKENESRFKLIRIEDFKKMGKIQRLLNVFALKGKIRKCVRDLMKTHDIIWTTTDSTISLIGKDLLGYENHVMQLMELVEDAPVSYYKICHQLKLNKLFKVHLDNYAKHAKCMVVPEINRAHIFKAMWGLSKLPAVLPNKPYRIELSNPGADILKMVETLQNSGKKLILYQGVFLKERKLEEFAQAVSRLGDEYAFCIMGSDTQERKQLCEKYPEIIYIPFIAPPYHLLITRIAHIGVLTYFPTADNLPGKLNIVYCAPNKIYEYTYSELPMIGNNIPGLSGPFEKYHIGKCFDELNAEVIAESIREIEKEYDAMKSSCKAFYEDVNMKAITRTILNYAKQ